jgi:hypothetical protein
MADLSPEFLSAHADFSKTLFMLGGNAAAVLVQRRGRRMARRTMNFVDAHAALDWCAKNSANFYFFQPADPARH